MAARSFRVIIRNQTQNLVLSQSFNHLCQGNWTTGQAPPGVIGFAHPGGRNTIFVLPNLEGTGVLQSESDWGLGSTEGYVKYDVLDATQGTGQRIGMVYIYWNNPFYGVTHCRFAADPTDIAPDCDFSGSSGSSFKETATDSLPFTFTPSWGVVNASDKGMFPVIGTVDDDPQAADFAAGAAAFAAGATVGGVINLAASTGVVDHAWIQIDLLDGSPATHSNLAGQSEATTYTRNLAPTAAEWSGNWTADSILVQITPEVPAQSVRGRFAPLTVGVTDTTAAPPVNLSSSISLGVQVMHPGSQMAEQMAAAPTEMHAGPRSVSPVVQHLRAFAGASAGLPASGGQATMGTLPPRLIEASRNESGTTYSNGTIYLPNGITLRLYDQFTGKTRTGEQIVYQRVDPNGKLAINRPLIRQMKIG